MKGGLALFPLSLILPLSAVLASGNCSRISLYRISVGLKQTYTQSEFLTPKRFESFADKPFRSVL